MRSKLLFLFVLTAFLAVVGCGGTGGGKSTSQSFEMTLLQGEGTFFIQGRVFDDANGNAVMDSGESGLGAVSVSLVDVASTSTDAEGYYSFLVTPGDYTVEETDPAGFLSTTPNSVAVSVTDQDFTVNFGDQAEVTTYSIFGTVFEDLDLDGVFDAGEPGIPDVTVTLVGVGDMTTAVDGTFSFAVAATGEYVIAETDPEGVVSTTPNEFTVQVVDADVQVDFGDVFIIEVPVDVKPGSDINPLNLRSKGVLPVAILGAEDFDVSLIDPASLLLNGVAPLRWSYEDVCGPDDMSMDTDGDMDDDGHTPDGYGDMTLKFSTQEIAATLGEGLMRGDIVTLSMVGTLMDGMPISGEEMVWIVQVPK